MHIPPGRRVIAAGFVMVLVVAVVAVGWSLLSAGFQGDRPDAQLSMVPIERVALTPSNHQADTAPPSRAGATDDGSDPLLVPGLRDTLEALLLAAGESPDPATLKQRLQGLVAQFFSADLATRALAMAERYVDYRVALGELRPPDNTSQAEALRESILARNALRRQFFDETEYAALFADQESLDSFTLARRQIEQNQDLTPAEKTTALAGAESELSPEQRSARAYSQVQVDVAAQTARFDAQATDDRTRWTARSAQFGEGAATRLAALDRQERDWNQRLDAYEQAQQARASASALEQLRTQTFTSEEALRLDAALAVRRADRAGPSGASAQP